MQRLNVEEAAILACVEAGFELAEERGASFHDAEDAAQEAAVAALTVDIEYRRMALEVHGEELDTPLPALMAAGCCAAEDYLNGNNRLQHRSRLSMADVMAAWRRNSGVLIERPSRRRLLTSFPDLD
jgi:hypothetical protein